MGAWPTTATPARCSTRWPPRHPHPAYGDDPAQVYDVRLPDRVTRGLTVVRRARRVLASRVRPDPRRAARPRPSPTPATPQPPSSTAVPGMPGGGWPGTARDVAAAVTASAATPTSRHPPVLVGHSAGGQLVAWAAAQPWAHGLRGRREPRRRPRPRATARRPGGRHAPSPTSWAAPPTDVPGRVCRGRPRTGSHPAYPRAGARPRRRRGAVRAERAVCRGAPRRRTCASRRCAAAATTD